MPPRITSGCGAHEKTTLRPQIEWVKRLCRATAVLKSKIHVVDLVLSRLLFCPTQQQVENHHTVQIRSKFDIDEPSRKNGVKNG